MFPKSNPNANRSLNMTLKRMSCRRPLQAKLKNIHART
jgi:hypothetical protein